jgi:iron complex outermembrane recepter protein
MRERMSQGSGAFALTPCAAAVALVCGLGSEAALAQSSRADALEEIVVTAERRETSMATTPISIEVLTDDFLAQNQIKDIIDLQNAVPALQFFQNSSYVQANIRGVGNPSRGGPSEQVGVPIFFDGATQGEEMGIASGFFDVSTIEVLRGPQATFVGQAAAGGAILINSARPNFDGLNGYVEATVGDYGRRKINAAVSLPVSGKFAARLAYMSENRDSFFTNVAGSQSVGASSQWTPGDQQDDNYRLSLLWEPVEQFSLWTKLESSKTLTYGPPVQPNPHYYIGFWNHDADPVTPSIPVQTWAPHYQGPAPGTAIPNPATGGYFQGGRPGPGGVIYDPLDPRELANLGPQYRDTSVNRVSMEANWTFANGITFRSLSSNIEMDRVQTEGGDSLVYSSYQGWQLGPGMRTWSQEFNLISPDGNRIEWLVGLYKNDRHTELQFNNPFGAGPFAAILGCGWQYDSSWTPCPTSFVPGIPRFMWSSVDDVVHQAVFGQLNFHITDTVELRVEARHNEDNNVQTRATYTGATLQPTDVNTVPCRGNVEGQIFYCPVNVLDLNTSNQIFAWKGDLPTYKVGLNWQPRDGHFLYAFFARGYKSGQSTAFTANPIVEEVVNDIEIGWKGTIRPGLYAEFGLYSMDYEDMQLATFQTAGFEARQATANIGDSRIQGFEASLRAALGNFGLNLSFAYTDSELGEITTVDTRALAPLGLAVGGVYPGDIAKGCNPATATVGSCFDYSPYLLTFSGSQNPFAPEVSYNIGLDYMFELAGGGTIVPAVSYNYADETYTNTLQRPDDRYYRTDARKITNVSLSYRKNDWDVQFFINNATDELYIEGHTVNGAGVFYGDPRTVGARVRMTF